MPGKGGKFHFQTSSPSCSGSSRVAISLTAALTNMKLGREIKLCDVTNIITVKHCISWKTTKKQSRPIHSYCHMYVDVTDKEKQCERHMDKFLCPDDQHHSENLVNTVFLGKQQTASANVHAHIM